MLRILDSSSESSQPFNPCLHFLRLDIKKIHVPLNETARLGSSSIISLIRIKILSRGLSELMLP